MIATPRSLPGQLYWRKPVPFIPRRIRRLRLERALARISAFASLATLLAIAAFLATHLTS